jgi:hypothetical protein
MTFYVDNSVHKFCIFVAEVLVELDPSPSGTEESRGLRFDVTGHKMHDERTKVKVVSDRHSP